MNKDKKALDDLKSEVDRMHDELIKLDVNSDEHGKLLTKYADTLNTYNKLKDGKAKANSEVASNYAGIVGPVLGFIGGNILTGYFFTAAINFEKEGYIPPRMLQSFINNLIKFVRRK